ncbi:MAG: type II secretion system secretin GspD [Desulfobacteraceae bacterium]|nr:type II secretion system secretin GspD [Desulfobacteraceae bacterium]MBC2755769.1 type II secretion system secretin GspD [Desulfobacteraceae bacterium]
MLSLQRYSIVLLCACIVYLIISIPGLSSAQTSQNNASNADTPPLSPDQSDESSPPESFISIDFNDVDIEVFIKFISELTGKNFIIDRRVKGSISVISPTKISVDEAYKVFESVLEVHGYATVDAGEITKIIPSPYARTMNIETRLKKEADSPNDKIVTQLIHLKYADPNQVKQLCAPLVSKSSVVLAYSPTNMLIITDVYSNIKRLIRIIDAIDVTGIGQSISVLPVEFADADEMVKIIDSVFNASALPGKKRQKDVTLVSDKRTNIIIVVASETGTDRVRKLVKMLDKEMPKGSEKIHVYYLENAKAEELATVLQEFPTKESGAGDAGKGKKLAPIVSEDVKITADKSTNSLIIVAEKDDYEVLKDIIKKLDIRRSMLYLECLIMEINKDRSLNLGTEWQIGGEGSYGEYDGAWGGGFSGGAMGGDPGYLSSALSAATGSAAVLPPGFSVGVFGEAITVGGVVFPTIAAVINAYKKDKDAHILSTPQILTTDNETAKITVGKNVPYLTKASSGETNYSNYEYKDVGISLEVTPQISKDRQVRMEIALETTKLESTTDLFQPTTLKRTVNTTIIVNDTNTVVIGGLIDDALSLTDYKVPCLGDIPVFGWLFRSIGKGKEETNLYIFLTPHILEDALEGNKIYEEKKFEMYEIEEGQIKLFDEESFFSVPEMMLNE